MKLAKLLKPLIYSALLMGVSTTKAQDKIYGYAGTYTPGFAVEGGNATFAAVNMVGPMAIDQSYNIILADVGNARIRKIDYYKIITTVAGSGVNGYTGDGGSATLAKIGDVTGLAYDASGNLYFTDAQYHCIRKINTSGVITTIAGTGTVGITADGAAANGSPISYPSGIAIGTNNIIYFSEKGNHCIRSINAAGIMGTYAGTAGSPGFSGDGGQATSAQLNDPTAIHVDRPGNMYIVDLANNRIRKVTKSGTISTYAGNGTAGFSGEGVLATQAMINKPKGITSTNNAEIYFTDYENHKVRKVDFNGNITTVVNQGPVASGYSGDYGPAANARIKYPTGIVADSFFSVYFSDYGNFRIRLIVDKAVGIDEKSGEKTSQVWYNPQNKLLNVKLTGEIKSYNLKLTNYLGQLVLQKIISENETTLELDLPKGFYLLQLSDNDTKVLTHKLIID